MKNLRAKIFVVVCTFIALCSCKKEPKLTGVVHHKYIGLAKGHYEYHNDDFENNVFTHIVWDTTYEMSVNVVIDYDLEKIKFSTQKLYYPGMPQMLEYDLNYNESKSVFYIETYQISGYFGSFRFAPGDSLVFEYRRYESDVGPNSTRDNLTLNAVKID